MLSFQKMRQDSQGFFFILVMDPTRPFADIRNGSIFEKIV